MISNVVDYDMGINAAVSAPRVHHQHLPDILLYERDGLADSMVAALRSMHYAVDSALRGSLGIGASILLTPTGVSGMGAV